MTLDPKYVFTVDVMPTALPHLSITLRWVVPWSDVE
jgi:hypothetical protein